MNIIAQQNRVCAETEEVYTHSFYTGLDGVAAALDNVDARERWLYIFTFSRHAHDSLLALYIELSQ